MNESKKSNSIDDGIPERMRCIQSNLCQQWLAVDLQKKVTIDIDDVDDENGGYFYQLGSQFVVKYY